MDAILLILIIVIYKLLHPKEENCLERAEKYCEQ